MKILVFKTDIKSQRNLDVVKPLFNDHPTISQWSIDREDIDNVLRIEAMRNLREKEVIKLVEGRGFYCEELPD